MDWGLEKDLFIPLRHQQPRLQVGQRAVVRVVLDEKSGRLFGSTRQDRFIQNSPKGFKLAQPVDLLILEESPLGFTALIDGRYRGMLFRNELFEPICVGDSKQGYIKAIRKDGKVDLALRASNEAGKKQGCDLLLQSLKEAGGSLPVGYKIDPDEAVRRFGMSRKAFKRALTQLSEQGAITIHEGGITLL